LDTDVKDTIETDAALVRRCDDGIIEIDVRLDAVVGLPQMEQILDAQLALSPGPTGVLVDVRPIRSASREALKLTANTAADRDTRAAAILIDSPVSTLLGNFFLKLSRPLYPTRLFRDADEARAWLHSHLADHS